ncbi:NERD domain-containing protein [Patulibacter minatonensis]|uniref:NERD domain-containing protein n=1 Tax=Patulibacter minatonensis TaxID=298163 RepID=UPI00047C6A51|nr:NERD domain-containing protein [Patulibacter minatonensis]
MIGLADGTDPDWWAPTWERGLRPDLPAGELFDALAAFHADLRVLHGLGVGGTGSTIDHVVIGAGGVVVVATDDSVGRVRTDGVHLRVRGRDRSPAVDVALWQAEVVRTSLEQRGIRGVAVRGVLHWEHLEGLGDKAICLRGVPLLSAGATVGLAAAGTTVSPLMVEHIAAALGPCPRMQ